MGLGFTDKRPRALLGMRPEYRDREFELYIKDDLVYIKFKLIGTRGVWAIQELVKTSVIDYTDDFIRAYHDVFQKGSCIVYLPPHWLLTVPAKVGYELKKLGYIESMGYMQPIFKEVQ